MLCIGVAPEVCSHAIQSQRPGSPQVAAEHYATAAQVQRNMIIIHTISIIITVIIIITIIIYNRHDQTIIKIIATIL